MGNHLVGQMFNVGVSRFSDEEIDNMSSEEALDVIDLIGKEVINTTSLDAEFDDYDNPNEKFGKMLIKAFYPIRYEDWKGRDCIDDEMWDEWEPNIFYPFRLRFGFY